uniref:Uncharacterized protein n=1 Tax=Parascaris univalens TaxID=6257 RepID=A0A915AG41_PARUN
ARIASVRRIRQFGPHRKMAPSNRSSRQFTLVWLMRAAVHHLQRQGHSWTNRFRQYSTI